MNISLALIYFLSAAVILILFFFFRDGNKSFTGIITGSMLAGIIGLTPSDSTIISVTMGIFITFSGYFLGEMIQAAIELNKKKKQEG